MTFKRWIPPFPSPDERWDPLAGSYGVPGAAQAQRVRSADRFGVGVGGPRECRAVRARKDVVERKCHPVRGSSREPRERPGPRGKMKRSVLRCAGSSGGGWEAAAEEANSWKRQVTAVLVGTPAAQDCHVTPSVGGPPLARVSSRTCEPVEFRGVESELEPVQLNSLLNFFILKDICIKSMKSRK